MTPSQPGAATARPTRAWRLPAVDREAAARIAATHNLPDAIGRMLASRGWPARGDLASFLSPRLASLRDPMELDGMDRAVARARAAIESGERIAVYGDYDADGLCATAIMVLALRHLGADPLIAIPHRIHDGYGMNARRLGELIDAGARLIITVDTGVSASAEVALSRSRGVDVIVTDHHLCEGPLPEAVAIVNPNIGTVRYPGGALCGSGVAFKLAHALLRTMRPADASAREFLRGLIDLAALATIADMVPLEDENRVIARHGLEAIASSPRPGIRALLALSRFQAGSAPTPEAVMFGLAPRLNAASRTDGDALQALALLLAATEEEAAPLAARLDALNRERRATEAAMLADCLAIIDRGGADDPGAFVLDGATWHPGVVGTVAARISERFHRPAVVLSVSEGRASGSARSIPGYDIHAGLVACRRHLIQFGGHSAAAGLRIEEGNIPAFRESLGAHATLAIRDARLEPTLRIDAEVEPAEVAWPLLDGLAQLQPFGESNPSPAFMLRGVRSATAPRVVGTTHLKLTLRVGGRAMPAIAFGLAGRHDDWLVGAPPRDIAFRPVENNFRGNRTLELELIDCRPSA